MAKINLGMTVTQARKLLAELSDLSCANKVMADLYYLLSEQIDAYDAARAKKSRGPQLTNEMRDERG